jgi:hypothetical protein
MKRYSLALLMCLTGIVFSGGGAADSAATSATTPSAMEESLPKAEDFTDTDIKNFADAQDELSGIQQDYLARIHTESANPDKAVQLEMEAQQKMVSAVQANGLSVDRYNDIAQVAQYDKELQQRILQHLEK